MRCLKRRLSDIVYRTMLDDVVTTSGTGPGGHRGASLISSAAGSQPHTDTSDQSLRREPLRRQMRPVSWAHMATSTRFRAPSFRMRLARWALTVLGVM